MVSVLPDSNRPYSRSEVIHRAGDESIFPAFERERPRIVNNFAASASSGYECSSISEKMNSTRLSNLAVVLESGNEYSDEDESSLETITSGYKEFAIRLGPRERPLPPHFLNMNESVSEQPLKVAAFVGIDWADEKHDVVLRSASDPARAEHQVIKNEINALNDWIAQMQERFGAKGKVLVCLEQSRGALIYQLMAYELFELYPINPSQLAYYRKTFFSSGAKDDRPDADLLSELLMCHRDRLKAWKPDDQLTRELASLNEGRRGAVDRRTELANEIKSQLKVYFPVALQILDDDITTALAADLLVQWPTLAELQKVSPAKLRKFFYGHNSRQEKKILKRLALIKEAKPLTTDLALIRPNALKVKLLARQLKSLLPFIAEYERRIAELFGSHPDRFLFDNLPGAGPALAPRLLTAFGTDRDRFEVAGDLLNLSGIAPVRIASGKKTGKSASVHCRRACPKFLRQSFHEFGECSIRYCPWAQACYQAQRGRGKGHHAAVRAVTFKWIRILFACWKQRTPYDPQRYLQALQTRGSDYAQTTA
jgi:transposase